MVTLLETLKAAALEADVAAVNAATELDRAKAKCTDANRFAAQAWKAYLAARVDAHRAEREAGR